MNLKILLIILIFFSFALAQETLIGRVLDKETSRPLTGADVYFKISKIGTTTDQEGFFKLTIPRKNVSHDSLVLHYVGYHPMVIPFHLVQQKKIYYLQAQQLELEQPIEVEAERLNLSRMDIPHLTRSIRAEEIRRYATPELATLLRTIPAIRLQGNEIDGKQLEIRGSNANEVNVYLDGVLLNDLSSSNTADLSLVPVDNLSKIEIHKTAHMLLNGGGAFGGVINLITKQPEKLAAELKMRSGSFNSRQYFGNLGLPMGQNWTFSYFGQLATMNPKIEFFPDERFLPDKSENNAIKQKKFSHYVNLNFQKASYLLNGKLFYYGLKYKKPGWQDNRKTLILSDQNQLPGGFNLTLNYLNSADEVQRYVVSTSKDLYDYHSQRFNVRLFKSCKLKKGAFKAFSEYWHERLTRKFSIQDSSTVHLLENLFFYDNRISSSILYTFTERSDSLKNLSWKVHFGLRGDASASGYRDLTNAVGALITWRQRNHQWRLLLSYGHNVHYPTLFEMVLNRDFTIYTLNDTTQKKLEPEYSQSFDLGVKVISDYFSYFLPQIEYDISFFYRTVYNKLLKQPFGEYLVQAQIGRNRTLGFEGAIRLNRILGFTNLQAGFTRLYITDRLLYEFKPELQATVAASFIHRNFYLNLNYFYEGKSYGWYYDQLNRLRTTRLNGYADMDVTLGLQTVHLPLNFQLQLSVYNLFDRAGYRYYYLNKRFLQLTLGVKY